MIAKSLFAEDKQVANEPLELQKIEVGICQL